MIMGVLAHVDAGKTTLSEGILYLTGTIRKMGRVDNRDTFLDTDSMERDRGITVFSKEARFKLGDLEVTLVDTPGHADFSTEMERTLSVLDMAVLVVSGAEGVQSHTRTLIRLFELYEVPFIVFVNKMDMPGTSRERSMDDLKKHLPAPVDMSSFIKELREGRQDIPGETAEEAATCSEELMNEYLESGAVSITSISAAVASGKLFPVVFGSALKMEGVDDLLRIIELLAPEKHYSGDFGAVVYKITRDAQGKRLTHMKITGGTLKNKMVISEADEEGCPEEKAEQIRLYNGEKFTAVSEAEAGTLCAVLGPAGTYGGQRLGSASLEKEKKPVIEPSLTYTLALPEGDDPVLVLRKMKELEEEDPALRVSWEERTKEIRVSVMGELEKDMLEYRIKEKFGIKAELTKGRIIYKETITEPVEGIGHYEPLRHYAEVRLMLEPLPEGSGLVFESRVSEDDLAKNWQRLILKHLEERRHKGTMTGAEITDMRISLTAGRAHLKHTEGGDFRQATYRAVRQGLRRALAEGKMRLLEPMYDFTITVPGKYIGRVMTDMDRLGATFRIEDGSGIDDMARITGRGPVETLSEYQMELNSFAEGFGRFDALPGGYGPCHNEEEVLAASNYDCDSDIYNPCGSVFTDHGAGVYVDWDQVNDLAHTEGGLRGLRKDLNAPEETETADEFPEIGSKEKAGEEKTLKAIFEKTYGKSKRDEQLLRANRARASLRNSVGEREKVPLRNSRGKGKSYLIIDGYNVLFAWDDFKALREASIDGAREALIEVVRNYQGYTGAGITLVFDGYKLKGNIGEKHSYGDLNVVYTKEAETADRFIEEFAFEKGKEYDITVVTSDRPVQMSALGDGTRRLSSREFYEEVAAASAEILQKLRSYKLSDNRPFEEFFMELNN